jgi:mRNA interferase MazF
MDSILRGDIFYCDLGDALGSEQQFRRPVLIVQSNELNRTSPTTIVVPITAQIKHPFMPAHYILDEHCPLHERSMVLAEQVRAVDKRRLQNCVGRLKEKDMLAVEKALGFCLGLGK